MPLLITKSLKVASDVMKHCQNKGLSHESTLALVCYTADMRQFGALAEQNLHYIVNSSLWSGNQGHQPNWRIPPLFDKGARAAPSRARRADVSRHDAHVL